ncbi:MAG: dTDP-4-dehydrorhamnose reductase [Ignisphaera sp.]|uniref:dTDP-4-dehydrorhamnose reductase n=1 Tax=Ignisphaera aggregans TaxID=334771 RepID=A0A7J3MXZ7_9CREN
MKVFVTGASSTPGCKIMLELARAGYKVYAQFYSHEIPPTENVLRIKLDFVNDLDKIAEIFNEVKPDVVIHTAALGDVDKCETDKRLAWRINVEATHAIAKKVGKFGSYILYLSTDYVFDGEKGMYREEDVPNPINFYGLTKLVAENIVNSATHNYSIIRTSHIYGFGMGRKNFARHVIESLSQGIRVKALIDQWLSPTLNTLLAKAIREIIEKRYIGVFHVAGEKINRYDFAIAIANKFNFDISLIEPIYMREIKFLARRPRDSSLETSKARTLIKIDFYTLSHSLDVVYNEWLELQKGK